MSAGIVVWFTGLPASGKTTLARRVRDIVSPAIVLDSDELRDVLGFATYDAAGRDAFYTALGRLAAMLAHQGFAVLVAATAPRQRHRDAARALAPRFVEVHVATPLAVCEQRDPKGLYRRARTDEASTLPGVGAAYEAPVEPDIVVVPGEESAALTRIAAACERTGPGNDAGPASRA